VKKSIIGRILMSNNICVNFLQFANLCKLCTNGY